MILRRILGIPQVYNFFQRLLGAENSRTVFLKEYVGDVKDQRVLDLGCGTGELVRWLPQCYYMGEDLDADYIRQARQRFAARPQTEFICEDIKYYINFPTAVAEAMEFEKGEVIEWIIEDKANIIAHRRQVPPSPVTIKKNLRFSSKGSKRS